MSNQFRQPFFNYNYRPTNFDYPSNNFNYASVNFNNPPMNYNYQCFEANHNNSTMRGYYFRKISTTINTDSKTARKVI